MDIKQFIEDLNLKPKVLIAIIGILLSSIPVIWYLSSNTTLKTKRLDVIETNINDIKTQVAAVSANVDNTREDYRLKWEIGLTRISDLLISSEQRQTEKLKFVVDNYSAQNKDILNKALDIRQKQAETDIDKIIDGVIKGSTPKEKLTEALRTSPDIIVKREMERDPIYYMIDKVSLRQIDSLAKLNYKILNVKVNSDNSYKIEYRTKTYTEIQNMVH